MKRARYLVYACLGTGITLLAFFLCGWTYASQGPLSLAQAVADIGRANGIDIRVELVRGADVSRKMIETTKFPDNLYKAIEEVMRSAGVKDYIFSC
ncbi:MAG: hypothetical protein EOM25_12890, partial [Deltaproteobacteria bacterium]|nr:hypothetical protein [Deltaproteobacteria bacterium]